MKKIFEHRLDAIDWIANTVQNEGQFEALRETLNYNFIYHGYYFLEGDLEEILQRVVVMHQQK